MKALQEGKALLRYLAGIIAISIGLLLLLELAGWIFSPERYRQPPAVTADAWIYSDAIQRSDTVWMKEFVEEFCDSYNAYWVSYLYFRRYPFAGKHINIDSSGIRRTDQAALGSDTTRPTRIFLLGGSTMWGTGARDSGTIPSALAREIAADSVFGPAEVVNLGESGYVNTQDVLRLELELRKGNIPDIVILYDGVNDVYSSYQNGGAGLPQNESHRAEEFNLLKDYWRMMELGVKDFLGRTVTAGIVSSIREKMTVVPSPPPPELNIVGEVIRMYRGNLETVDALSRQYGFRYAAYWQPVVFTRHNPSLYEEGESEKQKQVRPLFLEAYRQVRQDSILQRNPHFHDISRIFDNVDMPVFLDFCHISEPGNAIVARRMYADLTASFRPRVPF
jgi:hypothetical protein